MRFGKCLFCFMTNLLCCLFLCTVPQRPHELKLPSELLYASCACADRAQLADIRSRFKMATQGRVRRETECEARPPNCLVEEVVVDCHREPMTSINHNVELICPSPTPGQDRFRRRSTTGVTWDRKPSSRNVSINLAFSGLQPTAEDTQTGHGGSGNRARRSPDGDLVTRRRHHRRRRPGHVISIQFILSTRVAESDGDWPEEFHLATARLYAMFDAIDDQFVAGELDDHVEWTGYDHNDDSISTAVVQPIIDSLASARISAVCEIGFQFNATTLLCGK